MSTVSAAILIGGRARRLGGAFKPGLRIGPQSILERQLSALDAAAIRDVMLVGRAPVALPRARRLADAVDDCGPLGGLYTALIAATTPVVLALAGDMPFVDAALIGQLVTLAPDEEAAVLRIDGRWHPLCGAYRRSVAARLKRRLDARVLRLSDALAELRVREVYLDGDRRRAEDLLININTPDDHARAARLASIS